MIQANDLRIGNYIGVYYQEQFIQFHKVEISILQLIETPEISRGFYFKPIPLTEEILLKCKGFYKDNYKKESKNHSAFYSISHIDYKYSFAYADFRDDWGFYHSYTDAPNDDDNNKFDFISCGIKYLHQLQNLYFALTGEELNIEL